MSPYFTTGLLALLGSILTAAAAPAATITINQASGAVYDAIIDGFPGAFPKDGTPDATGNALSVALKNSVTEMRGIAELPLDDLDGLTSADVVSATLTFNIDDVIGSFGPGASFDGTAAENIFIWAWDGNGTVDLSDFNNIVGAPTGSVITGAHGAITDTTLASSGAVSFAINVTAALKARLDASASFIGITFATLDENTASSIDDLGFGGSGPAGANGSALPFLTVVTAEAAPPDFDSAERKCQATLAKVSGSHGAAVQKALATCFNRVLKAVAAGNTLGDSQESCRAQLDSDDVEPSKLAKARIKAHSKILGACEAPLTPASINSPCNSSASSFADVAACSLDAATTNAEKTIRSTYANACPLLTAVGLDSDYPTVCTVE